MFPAGHFFPAVCNGEAQPGRILIDQKNLTGLFAV
jgi:hypothetical protein